MIFNKPDATKLRQQSVLLLNLFIVTGFPKSSLNRKRKWKTMFYSRKWKSVPVIEKKEDINKSRSMRTSYTRVNLLLKNNTKKEYNIMSNIERTKFYSIKILISLYGGCSKKGVEKWRSPWSVIRKHRKIKTWATKGFNYFNYLQ